MTKIVDALAREWAVSQRKGQSADTGIIDTVAVCRSRFAALFLAQEFDLSRNASDNLQLLCQLLIIYDGATG